MIGNAVKKAAATGARIRGIHLTFPSTSVIEILAHAGIDFVYFDGEHGPFDGRDLETCCLAAERHGITAIARVPDPSASTIVSYLDRGVRGLVIPHVESAADAREAVNAAYYSPLGGRSFGGGRPHYGMGLKDRMAHFAECNADVSLGIMLESRTSLEAVHEIAAVEGVDYLNFGLNDLSQSLGVAGQPDHDIVKAAVEETSGRVRQAGKPIREDFMSFAWINQVIVSGARQLVG